MHRDAAIRESSGTPNIDTPALHQKTNTPRTQPSTSNRQPVKLVSVASPPLPTYDDAVVVDFVVIVVLVTLDAIAFVSFITILIAF